MPDSFENVLTARQHRVLAALSGRNWRMDELRWHCEPGLPSGHWTRIIERLQERNLICVDVRQVSITAEGRDALENQRVVDVHVDRGSEHLPRLDRDLLRAGGYIPPEERERATRRIRERNAARVAAIMKARR